MARIPTYERQNLPGGIPQVATPSGRSPIAGGLQVAADAFQDVARADDRFQAAKRQKEEEDNAAWATKTYAQGQLDLETLRLQMQTEADAKGDGAPGFRGNVEKAIDDYTAKVLENAPTEVARQRLSNQFTLYKAGALTDAMGFEVRSRVAKRTGDMNEAIDLSRNAVSTNPAQFGPALDNMLAGIDVLQIPAEKKEILRTRAKNGLASAALGAQIDRDPAGILTQLRKGEWDQYVDPDQKLGFINGAEAEIKRREAEAKQAANEAKAQYLVGFEDYVTGVASGYVKPDGRYADVGSRIGGQEGVIRAKQLAIATETGLLAQEINTATPAELAAIAAKQTADLSSPENFRLEAAQAGTVAKLIDDRNKALVSDPADFVIRNAPKVAAAYQAATSAQAAPDAMQTFITANLAEQERLGVPYDLRKPLPAATASNLAASFFAPGANGGQVGAANVKDMAARFGSYWPGVYAQMSKDLPASVNVIANMDDPAASELLARTEQKGGAKELEKVITSDEQRDIKDALTVALGDAYATFAPQNGIGTYNQLYSGAYTLALAYRAGSPGMSANEAAQKAADAAINSRYTFYGTYRVPRGRDTGGIAWAADHILEYADLPSIDTPAGLDRAAYLDSLSSYGQWVTSGDERGLVLINRGGYAVTSGGKPVVWTWEQLEGMAMKNTLEGGW